MNLLIQFYLAKHDLVLPRSKGLVESAASFWDPVSFISKSVWFYFSPSRYAVKRFDELSVNESETDINIYIVT